MKYQLSVLSNGLRVVHIPMPAVRSVSIAVFVGVGSRYETMATAGVSHLIEHLLFRGTARRPRARTISEVLDSVGGILNASTDKELTVYWAKVAQEHFPLALDLLADLLQNSLLRPADVNKEKGIVEEELGMLADDPQDRVGVLTEETLWPGQPLGREIAGTRESVRRLKRAPILSHLRTYYGPNNVVISVAGGIDAADAFELVNRCFGQWMPVAAPAAAPAWHGERTGWQVETKDTEQVNLCIAYPGVPRRHPDRWAIDMLTTILGGGASSRLFVELRDRLAMVYDVHMYAGYFADTGSIVLSAGVDPVKLERAVAAMFKEIDRICRRGVPAAELAKARAFFRGRLWLGLEDSQSVAAWHGAQHSLSESIITPEDALARVEEVRVADLARVARTYLAPRRARMVAVGPLDADALPPVPYD